MFESVTKYASRAMLAAGKHSPTILAGVGVGAIVAGTFMAVRGAFRSTDKVRHAKDEIANAIDVMERVGGPREPEAREAVVKASVAAMDVVKAVMPGIALIAVGTGCLLGGHHILSKRYAAVAAAYQGLSEAYKRYRSKVQAELGEEREQKLYYDVDAEAVEDIKEAVASISPYARFFDPSCESWSRDNAMNVMTLKRTQELANRKLRAQGHLFLNEVYDMLGLKRSSAGAVVGWVYNQGTGDDYVDFGVFGREDDRIRDFFNGWESSVLLDFNVDGVIYELI